MTITVIPETRTDPKDVILQADGYEIIEAIIESFMDDGNVPSSINLIDQNGEYHEIIVDDITNGQRCALETIYEFWPVADWDDAKPVVEEILAMPKKWLQTIHDVEEV